MPLPSTNITFFTHTKSNPLICLFLTLFMISGCSVFGLSQSDDHGKRTLGTQLNDQLIESRGKSLIRSAHAELSKAHLNITAFNGTTLISGQVPSEEARLAATRAITGLRHVTVIHNELVVAGPTSIMSRTNDSYLTAKVKSALLFDKNTEGGRTKVVTENGTVFLLGLLTRNEAELAVSRARAVFGVQKIVKIFEYIN